MLVTGGAGAFPYLVSVVSSLAIRCLMSSGGLASIKQPEFSFDPSVGRRSVFEASKSSWIRIESGPDMIVLQYFRLVCATL